MYAIGESISSEITCSKPQGGLSMTSEAPFTCLIHLMEVMKHLSSIGCLSSQYRVPPHFPCRERVPKIWYFVCHLSVNATAEMTQCHSWWAGGCYQKLPPPFLYTKGRLWNTSAAMDGSPWSTSSHFTCWEGTHNLAFWIQFQSHLWQRWHDVTHNRGM